MTKMLIRLTWGSARVWLCAVAVFAAGLAVAHDRTPTSAVNPEVLPSISASAPAYAASALLVKGGHLSALNFPCIPGDSDPTTLCLRVWAKGVNNSTGVSAFQVHYQYPDSMLTVSAAGAQTTWLSSTGRSAACPGLSFTPGNGTISCNTLLAPPPFGPTGDGILATLAIESRDVIGPATFTLASDTYLVDTPPNPDNQAKIPATIRSISIYVAPCADFNADGRVTIADILYVVGKYHTSDVRADLDASGLVLVNDILIAVGEFSTVCTR